MSISTLIRQLAAAGAPPEAIAIAVEAVEQAQAGLEQQRAGARERKQRQRAKGRDSHGTVTGQSRDEAVTVTAEPPCLDKESFPQTPFKEINPTPESVCDVHTREADPIGFPLGAKLLSTRTALLALIDAITDLRAKPDVPALVDAWNAMAKRRGLPQVGKLTEERRKRIGARFAEHGPDAFTEAIAAVERSPFCLGDSNGGWRADFDFLLQASSFTKLIEGSYDRAPAPAARTGVRLPAPSRHPGGRTGAASARVFGGMG
jgi:hypothetical protein